jgi:hypothetical protein
MTTSHVTILAIALLAAGCVSTARSDLTIKVDAREVDNRLKTMSLYRLKHGASVKFRNESDIGQLVVTPRVKKGGKQPFCDEIRRKPVPDVKVPKKGEATVHICDDFTEGEILYTAQIEGAAPEDPIVIIEH